MTTKTKSFSDYSPLQRLFIVFGVASSVICIFLFIGYQTVNAVKTSKPVKKNIEYVIKGSYGYASLTYENKDGGTSQIAEVKLPYKISLGEKKPGESLYISAQNTLDRGDITVQILINGSVFKESSSTGGYTIATASGIIP